MYNKSQKLNIFYLLYFFRSEKKINTSDGEREIFLETRNESSHSSYANDSPILLSPSSENGSRDNIMGCSGGSGVDDKKIRRQIANCNERRRMQSINAGFQTLRQLLPKKDGEKISKVNFFKQKKNQLYF